METSNRLISVHILEILSEYALPNKRMEQAELMRHLEEDYGESISRHTCSDYLKTLRTYGYIQGSRGVFLNHLFTDEEIRLLIDGIMYGGHLVKEDAMALIAKLRKMQGGGLPEIPDHLIFPASAGQVDNAHIHDLQDLIGRAIVQKCMLRIEREPGEFLDVNPYAVFPDKGKYYLLCGSGEGTACCELQRIRSAEILEEPLTPPDQSFSFESFLKDRREL